MDEKKPTNPLDNLRDVVGDLWTSTVRLSQENTAQLEELTRELEKETGIEAPDVPLPEVSVRPAPAAVKTPGQTWTNPAMAQGEAPAPVRRPAPRPAADSAAFPAFESFWRTADETVDWTDALAHDHCTDGLTSDNLWAFFHENAEAVLSGDIATYLEVLKVTNPLGDLTPYGRAFNVRAESADRLSVSFEALPQYVAGEEKETRRYLSGMSLRCARDLMALLPVCKVRVEARVDGEPKLTVPFERQELHRVRFAITDPEALVLACGGTFAA